MVLRALEKGGRTDAECREELFGGDEAGLDVSLDENLRSVCAEDLPKLDCFFWGAGVRV